jgi:hypothetical protein
MRGTLFSANPAPHPRAAHLLPVRGEKECQAESRSTAHVRIVSSTASSCFVKK